MNEGTSPKAGNGEVVLADGERDICLPWSSRAQGARRALVGPEQMGIAERHLLIEDADGAIGLAVQRQRNGGMIDAGFLAVTDAQEP